MAGALVSGSVSTHAGYDEDLGRNDFDQPGQYIVDRVCSSRSYEVVAMADAVATYARQTGHMLDWAALVADGLTETGQLPRNLLGHSLQYYDGPAFTGLAFGQLGDYGALTRSETLLLTPDILQAAYGTTPTLLQPGPSAAWPGGWPAEYPVAFQQAYDTAYPTGAAGYHVGTPAAPELVPGGYYQRAERRQYDFQLPGRPLPARGLVCLLLSPLGDAAQVTPTSGPVSRVAYDAYHLLPTETTDMLGHTTTARYDYRLLQACLVTDPNRNRTAYGFSPLGLLRQTGLLGKAGP